MAQISPPCPANSFEFNTTLCSCNPGYLPNSSANSCSLFRPSEFVVNSGVDYSIKFPETILSFDSIKRFTQSQAVFLEATGVMLVSWLLFCWLVRFGKVDDGKSIWFKIRWWISRLDICFSTRHWLDDQKVVRKRKTELGGTFSMASWILFIGLFAALLYQIISKRTVEVHNVRATNGPELLSFVNDMEFNITTISSMSCSHLRGLGTLVTGTPASIDYRVSSLSIFANYSCHNTSLGPTITLKCSNCHIPQDEMYISWHFVDLSNNPATAVGFDFNFTAKNPRDKKHMSFVSGTVKNGSIMDDRPVTFRGSDVNILKFHLFPRIYHNLHDLKLIQPLFHEFRPGSSFLETNQLQASLQGSKDGIVNTTLFVNFLSAYIIEIDNENINGPVSVFADLGGLYAVSFGIFFYLLVQCEFRVKKLRDEDGLLRNIRNRKKAKAHWDKLRKYVKYTWDCSSLDDNHKSTQEDPICCCVGVDPSKGSGSLKKRRKPSSRRMDTISLNQKVNLHHVTNAVPENEHTERVASLSRTTPNLARGFSHTVGEHVSGHEVPSNKVNGETEGSVDSCSIDACQVPVPPVPDSETSVSDLRKNLQTLYEYNVHLRENFIQSQSMLEALAKKVSQT